MAAVYENYRMSSNEKRSHLTDKDSDKREVRSVKWSKVLLIVVGVSLVFALGVICALSLLYAGKFRECDIQKHIDTNLPADPKQKFSDPSCKFCEEGWTSYGGKCYFFSSETQTWFKARDLCAGLKGYLVTINSKAVQDFLVSKIIETTWIGLNDVETEGRWVWLNNQTLNETAVQFWFVKEDGSEPDNAGNEDCACLGYLNSYLKSWFDASCETKKMFICEKEHLLTL
ncbi:CD209 antigen-like protein C isoform X2 [Misgurnus anguillicaudatus]|uniref:CD209 antigen-like protein C isoform X2 n=1 Tax=Misgurnus anguillicaudatus TaxID=75329 RepID=UPI003CCF54DD